jgi:hypothetical protein
MSLDQEATESEQRIAADAEAWHFECARRGHLYEQPVGETVLRALVLTRKEREKWVEELASEWESAADDSDPHSAAIWCHCATKLRERAKEGP